MAPPTSLLLTVAPCDSNFNCVAGTTDAVSQWVRITAHVVYTGTTNPTGTLCILDNGSPANCGLTPAADENWFVNSLAGGTHKLSATYAGNSSYGASTSGISTLIVGSATPPPPAVVAPTITLQPVSQTVAPGQHCNILGSGYRHRSPDLSVEQERHRYSGRDVCKLHDSGNDASG